MKRHKIILLVFLAFFMLSFGYFKKDAIACELIGVAQFYEVSPNLYVDKSIDNLQQGKLANAIEAAVKRVSDVYGAPTSNPRIIATAEAKYAKFGFNPTGMQTSGFFRECIFLGPKGLNTDVVAHELVHAEVRHRTNLLVELTQLPAWFIEGTGIQVDYRAPFLLENIDVTNEDVTKIRSVFYLSDFPNTNVKYYQASLIAVKPMNPKNMYTALERLNNGEQFEDVFSELL
ncbi:hypothetical protein CWB99_13745 [Pseudoalteromonas rubra]|uniref:Uncharacterized protein n=1 Tax=Pseudoalteromonas rubra TaxID=43658 RepID=A0A5S3WKD5_9GAMM|nr:hypothetical protein [Pseudoalteromonas rubra]TMP27750.1 hypothetical protein CWB99_13745 [Pseudoalteromonas rubra]TMP32478.1 hypothetical protein CWC00_12395 [Pseudoalteromonas rubra]